MENTFHKLVNFTTLAIVSLAFITLCYILFKWNSNYPEPSASYNFTIKLFQASNKDTILNKNNFTIINKKQLDSLNTTISQLNKQINDLQKIKDDMVKIRNEEGFFSKTSASIIALIVAVASFFGFKSVVDIKKDNLTQSTQTAEKIAQEVSAKTANETLETFTSQAESNIKKELRETISSEIDDNLSGIQTEILRLNRLIDVLQNPRAFSSSMPDQSNEASIDITISNEPQNNLFSDDQ